MKTIAKAVCTVIVLAVFAVAPVVGESQAAKLDENNPIKLGYLMPGTARVQDMRGMVLAVDEINAAGGVLGRPIKVIDRDTKFNPEIAAREAKDLIFREKVFWLQGTISSSEARAVSEVARQNKTIHMITSATSDKLMNEWGHRYAFRIQSNSYSQAIGCARGAFKTFGPKKKLYNISPDYEGGHAAWENFLLEYQKIVPDAKVVGSVFPKLGTQEYTPYLTAIMNSGADLIFSSFYLQDAQTMFKQSSAIGLNGKIPITGLWLSTNDLAQNFSADFYPKKCVGGTAYAFWEIDYPKNKIFYEKFKERFGVYPYLDFASYGITHEIARIIGKVGLDTEKVIDALEGSQVETPAGFVEMRKCDHQAMLPFYFGEVGPLPHGLGFYAATNCVKAGAETYHSCEEVLEKRKQK